MEEAKERNCHWGYSFGDMLNVMVINVLAILAIITKEHPGLLLTCQRSGRFRGLSKNNPINNNGGCLGSKGTTCMQSKTSNRQK